jgi:carboxypeptidase C (cathepsin A)
MIGLFLQAGPCSIQRGANRTRFNPHSWTDFAHMIYVE